METEGTEATIANERMETIEEEGKEEEEGRRWVWTAQAGRDQAWATFSNDPEKE